MSAPLLFQPTADAVYGFPNARRLARVDSPYQRIEVWDTPQLGRLFTLDGRPMTATGDEFIYHECMVHPAALAHPAPKAALVLGGGDGGAARQLLKHPGIERIVVAELDAEVVRLIRKHLPEVHGGAFDDPRVELVIGDAADYVVGAVAQFDLVVFDLTPPDSPAAGLYTPDFYMQLKRVMSPTVDALAASRLAVLPSGARRRPPRRSARYLRHRAHDEHLHPALRLALDDGDRQRHARPRRPHRRSTRRAPCRASNRRAEALRPGLARRTVLGIPVRAR